MIEDLLLPNGYFCGDNLNIPAQSFIIMKVVDEDRCNRLMEEAYNISRNIILLESVDRYNYHLIFENRTYAIRSRGADEFNELLKEIDSDEIYIDLTSLEIYEIPRLIKGFHKEKRTFCIYAEPEDYKVSNSESGESDYHLYDTHSEVAAIPGYSILRPDDNYNFVPLLGFQGNRLTYIRESLQPLEENIYPIVGIPGYKLEFGFTCITENGNLFESRKVIKNLRYHPSNAPFKIYRMLKKLNIRTGKSVIIGLLGTKPQALGSIIYAIKNPQICELIYDYPTKKQDNFIGTGRIYLYLVTDMWDVIDSVA